VPGAKSGTPNILGVQSLLVTVAVRHDDSNIRLRLDMSQGVVQEMPQTCSRMDGWVLFHDCIIP
jgi:hypothetical protein